MLCPSLRCLCGHSMWLPYSSSQDKELSQSKWSPKGVLSREVACPECGRVASYTARDVRWVQTVRPEDQTPGDGDVICWCIETGCDEELCDMPIEFHILSKALNGTEEVRFSMLRLFKNKSLQGVTCGRGHAPGKSRIRAVNRVG